MTHRGTVFSTLGVSTAQVALQHFFVWSYLNSAEGAGFHASKTLDALLLVNDDSPGIFIDVHGTGDRAGSFAGCILTMMTDYRIKGVVLMGVHYSYY